MKNGVVEDNLVCVREMKKKCMQNYIRITLRDKINYEAFE